MIHDAQMGSPTDTSDGSSSEEERAAYEDGRPSISRPQRSEVCNIHYLILVHIVHAPILYKVEFLLAKVDITDLNCRIDVILM